MHKQRLIWFVYQTKLKLLDNVIIQFNKIFNGELIEKLSIGFYSNKSEKIYNNYSIFEKNFFFKNLSVFVVFDFENKENLLF